MNTMKKALLPLFLGLATITNQAQVVYVHVSEPTALIDRMQAGRALGWGSDLTQWTNTISGMAAFVDDGTAADSLGCGTLVNGAEIAGKIAVTYRGTCGFSNKALNAQEAGAIGLVVINNTTGPAIDMGAGDFGGQITIPVVMINSSEGDILRAGIAAGTVRMRLYSSNGIVGGDVALDEFYCVPPRASAIPAALLNGSNPFSIPVGISVINIGTASATNVSVNARIKQDGVTVYDQTSTPLGFLSGGNTDVFVSLPAFSPGSFEGFYEILYSVSMNEEDLVPENNTVRLTFLASDIYGFARIDEETQRTQPNIHFRPGLGAAVFTSCIVFREPNASAVRADGIYFSYSREAPSVTGEVVDAKVFRWNDSFTDQFSATFNDLQLIASESYTYASNLNRERIYVPFGTPVQLENGQRYLFCVATGNAAGHFGYDKRRDHAFVGEYYPEPLFMHNFSNTSVPGTAWSPNYVTFRAEAPALCVRMTPLSVGVDEVQAMEHLPYPNPASNIIHVPAHGHRGNATLEVFDLSGKKVSEQRTGLDSNGYMMVDVQDIPSGTYPFRLSSSDAEAKSFRVVVTR
jgi:hypothetical protein